MNKAPLILITGATGAVGPLIVNAFHAAGYSVRTMSLDPPPAGIWPDDVETRIGDITDVSAVKAAMQGVHSVIHLAALLHIVNPSPDLQDKYERINVGGTSTVVTSAIQSGVRRVVLFSTIAVYGPSNGRILTEDTPPRPDTFYAQTKLDAEKIVLEAKGTDDGKIGTVLRLGAVYGSRVKGNYERLIHALAHHRFMPIGGGLNRRTLVYDKDVAQAALLAVSHPAAAGRLFNVTDGQFHTLNEIIGSICFALGRKPPRLSLPLWPSLMIADFIEKCSRATGLKLPAIRMMIDKYCEDVAVNGDLIQKELGFLPRYNLQSGWREAIREMRHMGYL